MELDDLKDIWKQQTSAIPLKGEAEIAAMLKGTSKSIVGKLKRSVWIELILSLVAGLAVAAYAFTLPSGALKWMSISIPLIFIAYAIYYIKKLMLLNKFDSMSENIRSNIETLINNLSGYLRFYKRSYTILYPVYFGLGVLFSFLERGTDKMLNALQQPKTILLLIVVALAFYISSTWLVDWLLRKLYGNHLQKLKTLLHDIG